MTNRPTNCRGSEKKREEHESRETALVHQRVEFAKEKKSVPKQDPCSSCGGVVFTLMCADGTKKEGKRKEKKSYEHS